MSDDPRTMTDEEAMIQSITGHSIYASNQANWHFLMYKLATHHFKDGSLNTARRIFLQLTQDAWTPRQILAYSYHALALFGPSLGTSQVNLDQSRTIAQDLQDQDVKRTLLARLDILQEELNEKSQDVESRRAQQATAGDVGITVEEKEQKQDDERMGGLSPTYTPADLEAETRFAATVALPAETENDWADQRMGGIEGMLSPPPTRQQDITMKDVEERPAQRNTS